MSLLTRIAWEGALIELSKIANLAEIIYRADPGVSIGETLIFYGKGLIRVEELQGKARNEETGEVHRQI